MSYPLAMKVANIAEFKNHLSEYLAAVADGEEVEIRKRNVPLARVVPLRAPRRNRTVLGCGAGTVVVKSDLTEPLIPQEDWEMLGDEGS
ncbi:MAG: type II toxin-antitoxin system prevent-host-death family antitoxin [Acidobacteria bacterium]|nr:type II toxin-antitoxin system prevent-host-death family antitoxin [Acidobacteriota bacterium]